MSRRRVKGISQAIAGEEQRKAPLAGAWIAGVALLLGLVGYLIYALVPSEDRSTGYRPGVERPANSDQQPSPAVSGALAAQAPASQAGSALRLPTEASPFSTEEMQQKLLRAVEDAVQQYPQDASVLHIGAMTYAELLQTDRAGELFAASLAIDPTQTAVAVAYAEMLQQAGDLQKCADVLRKAGEQGVETAERLALLGEIYSQQGELELAQEVLSRGVGLFPQHGLMRLELAQVQVQLDEFELAIENAQAAIDQGQDVRAAYLAKSTALLKLGKRDEALEVRRKIPRMEKHVTADDAKYQSSFREFAHHTYTLLAVVSASQENVRQAEELLMQAIALKPSSERSLVALADILRRNGRLQDALLVLQRLVEVHPENSLNFTNAANLAIQLGDIERAGSFLKEATQHDSSGRSQYILARFLLGAGEARGAAEQAALAADRLGDFDSYAVWVVALRAAGDEAQAVAITLKARELFPGDPRLARLLE
ncbi:tetratricopeptide repeat protein [Aureliella helgolandensis]|uniref:Tetratricopeptide repeat protein n=1 Tax=Aureliella helgolandensis TaxID=2527968 RepID=A0A518GGP9_9BACT|nr:tetratricopeptide repeat protein [Aureliella helgolandensis]QDV27764.1 tetratricopeptide repeat protein [Aureliella helgolandensis]